MWRSVDGPVAILDNIIESESPLNALRTVAEKETGRVGEG